MDAEGVVEERHEYSPNINILVVDDDITTLNIVSAMLKTWSYQVVTVRNPIEALAILRKGKYSFDLVVTDLHMPQMNGLELQKLVHEEFELPVIMMSADDKESVIMKSLEGGVVYYIVKPVSKDDIKMVWQYVVQSRKSRFSNVTIEEMMEGAPGEFAPAQKLQQGPGELKDLDCVTSFDDDVNYKEGHRNDQSSKRKMTRKRDRDMEDEGDDDGEHGRRLLATKKSKVVWTNSLHNQFLMAIRHIGLDKAVPKRILEFMNVPGLTRENVASHLQKYRMFLKRVAEKARLSKCLSERVLRSNLLYSLPTTPSFNSVQREQYAEYLKQQLQMNDLGLAPPLQNTLAPLSTASHLGSSSFRFPLNYNQQPADLNLASSSSGPHYHQLFGPGQSRLLMNNAPHQQRPMQLGNGMNLFSQANRGSGFGMQTMNNNVGHIRGYGGLMNNNDGNCFMNGGTNWMQMYSQRSQAKQQQQTLNFTSNPFNFGATTGISSPSIDNMMNPFNNVNLGTNFRGRSSQPAGGLNNFINGGYGNGLVINNEVINGLTNGVRNVNLNGSTFNAPTQGTTIGNSSPTFETNSANQFASILPRHNQQQPNQYGMSSTVGGGNNEFSFSSLRNTTSNFNNISLADDDDDIMVINNILLQQLDNCQPPSHQKQGGEEVPVNFTSMLYQDEDPEPTLTPTVDKQVQPNNNHAATGQVQMNSNHVANSQVQLNPNPSVNGEVQLNPNPFVIGQVQLNPDPFGNAKVQLNPNPIVNDQDQLNPNSVAKGQLELSPTPIVNSQVQLNLNSAFNDEAQLNPNLCVNDLNSNPAVNSQLELNRTANGVGNPNLSSSPAVNRQLNLNSAFNDEAQLNPNLCVNDLNSNPAVNSQLELNRTANGVGNPTLSSSPAVNRQLDETTANQVGNPGFFGSGSYHMEDDAPDDEQSWSLEEQGGDQQMLNSEFNNNIFQSDDFSTLFDQQLPTQEGDDDFLNALMAFGDY